MKIIAEDVVKVLADMSDSGGMKIIAEDVVKALADMSDCGEPPLDLIRHDVENVISLRSELGVNTDKLVICTDVIEDAPKAKKKGYKRPYKYHR